MPSNYKEHLNLILGMRETWTKINDKVNYMFLLPADQLSVIKLCEFTVSKLDDLNKLMRET